MISRNLVNRILVNNLTQKERLLRGYILIIDGRVYTDYRGKFLFPTRAKLVQNFYNTVSWRAKRMILDELHPELNWHSPTYGSTRAECWKEFKKVLKEDFNAEIVEL